MNEDRDVFIGDDVTDEDDRDPGCEPWVEAETSYNGPEAMQP